MKVSHISMLSPHLSCCYELFFCVCDCYIRIGLTHPMPRYALLTHISLFLIVRWINLDLKCSCEFVRPMPLPYLSLAASPTSPLRRFSRSDLWSKLMVFSIIGSIHAEALAVVAAAGQDGEELQMRTCVVAEGWCLGKVKRSAGSARLPPRGGRLVNALVLFSFCRRLDWYVLS